MASSKSGRSWLDIRTNGAKFQWELNRMRTSVLNAPSQITKGYYRELQRIVWEGAKLGREHILNDTNTKKFKEGRGKGRVQSGDMARAFWANVEKESDKRYRMNVGYLGGKPGYAIFQEYGTSAGLVGVEALRVSRDYIDREVRKLGGGGRNYKSKIASAVTGTPGNTTAPDWFKRDR